MKKFYVYELVFNDGRFYIGYRGSKLQPEDDLLVKYFTSSKVVKMMLESKVSCTYRIIQRDMTQEDAYELEQQLIYHRFHDKDCLNEACYYGRDGFGVLSPTAKTKISQSSKLRWEDPDYRLRLSETHKKRWSDESLGLKQKQVERLSGVSRPDHSQRMKGRSMSEEQKVKLRKPKHTGHGAKVSASTKGIPKSESHKQNLKKPKPLAVCRLFDKREMALGNYMKWYNLQVKNLQTTDICC